MTFKERLATYYTISKNNKYIHPDTLISYIYDISGIDSVYLDNISEELSEERFIEFIKVLYPHVDSLELVQNIDPAKFISENGYVAGSRLLMMQNPELGIKESLNQAKSIESENNKLNKMEIILSYTGVDEDLYDGFGIASFEAKMTNGDLIRFDFMDESIFSDNGIATILCSTLYTEVFPESANIDINNITEITNIEFDDDGDYANINQIESIIMYNNSGQSLELKPWQLVTINNKLSSRQ